MPPFTPVGIDQIVFLVGDTGHAMAFDAHMLGCVLCIRDHYGNRLEPEYPAEFP